MLVVSPTTKQIIDQSRPHQSVEYSGDVCGRKLMIMIIRRGGEGRGGRVYTYSLYNKGGMEYKFICEEKIFIINYYKCFNFDIDMFNFDQKKYV